MASRVQFKFKSAVTSETVLFDGTYISVGDLKREIVDKKGLSKDHAAELLLSEAQTGRGTHTGEAHLLAATPRVAPRRRRRCNANAVPLTRHLVSRPPLPATPGRVD